MLIEEYCNLSDGYVSLRNPIETYRFGNIYTGSGRMIEQIQLINRVAKSSATVIIWGETGTGKEVYAEYIHSNSLRGRNNYIKINCATLSETLFESEMFGYTSGSFTGALKNGKKGMLEIANGGTLFLDEISEMSKNIQSKFLRVLQENSFLKVGSGEEVKVDVRYVAATNRDLRDMVQAKEFREDLFYRLNVVPVQLLPLRERREDIIILGQYFLNHYNQSYATQKRLHKKLLERFLNYDWPGNVRELMHVIERLVLLSWEDITDEQLFENSIIGGNRQEKEAASGQEDLIAQGKSLKELVNDYEVKVICQYISRYKSLRKAAKELQISPSALSRKLKENHITLF